MSDNPYTRFSAEELILRDHLALDRTKLANERTLLGYIRTSLALIVAGVTFTKIFNDVLIEIIGWVFILMGAWLLIYGIIRFRKINKTFPRSPG